VVNRRYSNNNNKKMNKKIEEIRKGYNLGAVLINTSNVNFKTMM
jgi:hypothetical protein